MFHPRRAAAALAMTALFSVVACTEADNGNNTLAEDETPGAKTTSSASASAPGGAQSTAPAVPAQEIDLEAKDNAFEPLKIEAKAGDITIVMKNTGDLPHTFTQSDLQTDVNANAGEEARIELNDVKPGTYHFVCKYHEALKMVGDLIVT